jgi:plastocyanin
MVAGVGERKSMRKRLVALVVGASLLGVVGAVAPATAARKVNGLIIAGPGNAALPFLTARVVITKGSIVTFRNLDLTQHNVAFKKQGWSTPNISLPQAWAIPQVATLKPGTYPFVCTLHAAMKGSLIVR